MEIPKLPFRAEYAKSGRSSCKKCKDPIAKDILRMAVMVQSPFFDGMQANWHHFECFFTKCRPKDVASIEHFDSLRWEDQELIRKEIERQVGGGSTVENGKSSRGTKRNKPAENRPPDLNDYTVEYAKSKRSKCRVCEEFIDKDEVRISKKDYENEIAMAHGPTERWHHVDCFIKAREELEFFAAADILPGFKKLTAEDQKMLKTKIPVIKRDTTDGPSPPKKSKEGEVDQKKLKKQTEIMFKYRDQLEALSKTELGMLFEMNDQDVPEGIPRMLDRLSDAMTFGALERCKKCKGQLKFSSGLGYQCKGDISEWMKCQAVYPDPPRVPFQIPVVLKESYSFLKKYKPTVSKRIFVQTLSPVKVSGGKDTEQSKSILEPLKFFIHKTEGKSAKDVQKQIENVGGKVVKKWQEDVFAVISTKAELERSKLSKNLAGAKESQIHVLPENFFDDITPSISKQELITKLNDQKISSWGADPSDKIKETAVKPKSVYPSKSAASSNKSGRYKSAETVKTVTVKDGLAVDPDSKLEKVAHVYRRGDEVFSVVLSLTDLQTKKNSYYRLQILESDKKNKYWLFRAWGRIGTTIGGNKVEQHSTLNDCIEMFKELFLDKTGNSWEMRNNFEKVPGKMMIVDVQYKDQEVEESKPKPKMESDKLTKSVQDLITLIFDIEAMKKTMMEFELDLNKMPLGKISQKQIQKAFAILADVQNLINSAAEHQSFVEKTNMFYTLVPHDFGVNLPPLLDNEEIIGQKMDMLNSLMDIEIAYKMLQECEKADNSIDDYYKQLKAEITDLDRESEEFKLIQLYVTNTHAKTHMNYTLEIENVFKIERKGEAKRYEKFSKLPNRALLWHGSRITNVAGILSQGLRIAPPEAPVTGYMFGKGVYFADMVSKSANYCNTSKKNPTGLLLLCEVALGDMHELTKAEFIEKLPPGKNSVKGVGKTQPDPSEKVVTPAGVEIPLGKGVDAEVKSSSLLYNEYIVYNVAQIRIKYLLRMKFHHKM